VFLTLFGFLIGYFFSIYSSIALLILGIASSVVMGAAVYISKSLKYGPTATTFFSTPIIFIIGFLAGIDDLFLAVIFAILTVALSFYKQKLIKMIESITPGELVAALNVLVFGLLILLFLPNQNIFYGFNPFQFWLVVLTVSFIFFVQYIVLRRAKTNRMFLFALFGSIVSSTSTTYAISKLVRKPSKGLAVINTFVTNSIMLIAQVVFPLMMFGKGFELALKLLLVALIGLLVSYFFREDTGTEYRPRSPFPFTAAVQFGVILFLIIFLGNYLASNYTYGLLFLAILGGAANLLATIIAFIHLFSFSSAYTLIIVAILTAILEKAVIAILSRNRYFIYRNLFFSLIYAALVVAIVSI
jgi:uncharacterized membrane protein (DUF4010 family)